MPNIRELQSIVDYARDEPAIDAVAFPNSILANYWSSSAPPFDVEAGWYIDFAYGLSGYGYKVGNFYVRLVRGTALPGMADLGRPSSDYIDHQDGTVTHVPTGLMWQRCAKGQTWTGSTCAGTPGSYDWSQAKAITDNFAGHADWRLPSVDELTSLIDYEVFGRSLNQAMFPNTDYAYISATPYAKTPVVGWPVYFSSGYTGQLDQYATMAIKTVRLVRNGDAGGAARVPVVEYYNASLDHYFITWVTDEIAKLDAGTVIKGWTRTGKSFYTDSIAQTGTSPVCRYYIPPNLGNSHFFGRGAVECNATGAKNPSFILEDGAFMQMFLPVAGVCPANTTQVYRVFDNRPDANHRYMTDKATRDQMVAKGWLAEGDGPDLVVMCAPQ